MDLRLNFALEGFRLIRERPKLLLFWGAVCLFGYGICTLLFVAIIGPYQPMIEALRKAPNDVALAMQIVPPFLAVLAVCTPLCLLTSTVLIGAVCRASLEPVDDRLGFLSFGLREFRLLVVQTAIFLLSLAVLLIVALVLSGFGIVQPEILQTVATAALAWLQLRLSFNAVQTFATNRIVIFGDVELMRGRTVSLLGGYLLACGLAAIVWYLCTRAVGGIMVLAFGQSATAISEDMSSLQAFLTPQQITLQVLMLGFVMPQIAAIVYAAPVAAYRELTARKA
jgi:hypothetical protein